MSVTFYAGPTFPTHTSMILAALTQLAKSLLPAISRFGQTFQVSWINYWVSLGSFGKKLNPRSTANDWAWSRLITLSIKERNCPTKWLALVLICDSIFSIGQKQDVCSDNYDFFLSPSFLIHWAFEKGKTMLYKYNQSAFKNWLFVSQWKWSF